MAELNFFRGVFHYVVWLAVEGDADFVYIRGSYFPVVSEAVDYCVRDVGFLLEVRVGETFFFKEGEQLIVLYQL